MKFSLLYLFLLGPFFLSQAGSSDCQPADSLVGDGIYFSVKKAGYYNEDSIHVEIRLPYFYESRFSRMNVEALRVCPNGLAMTYLDTSFLISAIHDSCSGTFLEFNLLRLELVDQNGQKFLPPRRITKTDGYFLIDQARYWRLVPKK